MVCGGAIAAIGLGLTLATSEPVVFATEAPFAPYTMIDEAGQIYGFERDIADEVCRRALLRCEWQTAQFDQLLPGVMTGLYDVALGGIAVTAERQKLVDFTMAYNESTDTDLLYGAADAPPPKTARIAVQAGTIQESHARRQGWDVTSFGSPDDVIGALLAGRVDLAFGPFETELASVPEIAWRYEEQVPDLGTAMAVCRGNDALLTQLNTALDAMFNDGTIDEITARWL